MVPKAGFEPARVSPQPLLIHHPSRFVLSRALSSWRTAPSRRTVSLPRRMYAMARWRRRPSAAPKSWRLPNWPGARSWGAKAREIHL